MEGKKKKKRSVISIILFIIALAIFACAIGVLLHHYFQGKAEQNDFEALKVNGNHDLVALHKKNSDIVGWIKIDGTIIDYPVMQTPNEPEYYLRRNFEKKTTLAGTPFMDAASSMSLPSGNFLIYGHNMKNGSMFHSILQYEKKSYFNKHKIIHFDTLKGKGTYRVIAAFRSQIYPKSSKNFKYYHYAYIDNKAKYDRYVSNVKALSAVDSHITPGYKKQLITLSTCAYHVENGRFAVVAVKVN